jgi:hypothetical protein
LVRSLFAVNLYLNFIEVALLLVLIYGFIFLPLGMHVNKALYTFSYMCVTAGAAGIVFTGIYLLVGYFITFY